jgi:neutral ceramidase
VPMLFVNGAEGNVAPIYSVRPDFESSHIAEFKALLGDRILEANRSIGTTTSDVTLRVDGTTVETPLRSGLEWPDELADYVRAREDGVKLVRIPVRFLKINTHAVLWAAPLELFCEIAMNIRRESPFPYTFYFGITNGTFLYLPTRQAYAEGGYEPQVSVFTDRAEEDFTGAVSTYLRRMARQ